MWVEVARRGVEVFGAGTSRLQALGEFFERVHHGMLGGDMMVDAGDALAVLAALVHSAEPLTPHVHATALGRPRAGSPPLCATRRTTRRSPIPLRSGAPRRAPAPSSPGSTESPPRNVTRSATLAGAQRKPTDRSRWVVLAGSRRPGDETR
jgi:hypothetical protein